MPSESGSLVEDETIVGESRTLLREGHAEFALNSLFGQLGRAVGADDPASYSLSHPYCRSEVEENPYLRLCVGFTYEEIVGMFRQYFDPKGFDHQPVELVVSALLDAFIDRGAVVPTTTLRGDLCTRVYRKGEANPRWDEAIARLQLALLSLSAKDRDYLLTRGRTRIAKISAIMAMSRQVCTSLRVGALERGNVALLARSVVEREDVELTGIMRRLGLWR